MDIFIEKIVAKKKDIQDRIFNIGVIFAGVVAVFIILNIRIISSLGPVLAIGMAYGIYYVIKSRNIEFEYAVTNGDLDIDKIIAQRKRKRIFSANCKEFDIVAKLNGEHFNQEVRNIRKRISAISSMDSPDVYFITLMYNGEKTVVFFEPDKRMIDSFKTFIPRKVFE